MYFKITNKDENHNGFQYVNGLNILKDEFIDDPNQSCCKGGLYFTDAANIFKFTNYGIYLREILLPSDNPDFKMVKDKTGYKWRANMIILDKRYDLFNVDTFKYLEEKRANVHAKNDHALRLSARYGHLDVVKYLVEKGANVHAVNDYALRLSADNGHLDVVKYLVEKGANVHADNDFALGSSAHNGHLDVVKYLIEKGADIHAGNDCALGSSAHNGHLDVVKYLVENGADVHADNNYALRYSASNGHLDVVKYLVEKGVDVHERMIMHLNGVHTMVTPMFMSF